MDLKTCLKQDQWLRFSALIRKDAQSLHGRGCPLWLTSCNAETQTESYSLGTLSMWMKANGRKVKINAILNDASNETLLNEEVAAVLGLQEPFQNWKFKLVFSMIQWKPFSLCRWRLKLGALMGSYQKKSAWKCGRRKSQAITESCGITVADQAVATVNLGEQGPIS